MIETVDRMISLGGRCEVAYQIRRATRSGTAYPFDWWVTPLDSVVKVLEGGFEGVFEARHLVRLPDLDGKKALYSSSAGTWHLHEFRHEEDFLSYALDEVERRLRPKYAFLQSRLLEDCGKGRTLFIRQHLRDDPDEPEELRAAVERICAALGAISPWYRLLLLDYPPGLEGPTVIQRRVTGHPDLTEVGSDRGWDEMLATLPFSIARARRRLDISDLLATFPARRGLMRRVADALRPARD